MINPISNYTNFSYFFELETTYTNDAIITAIGVATIGLGFICYTSLSPKRVEHIPPSSEKKEFNFPFEKLSRDELWELLDAILLDPTKFVDSSSIYGNRIPALGFFEALLKNST